MKTKLKFVSFIKSVSVRVTSKNGFSENTYINTDANQINLIDFSHVEILDKSGVKVLALVPFSSCAYCHPHEEQEVLTSLDELSEEIKTVESDDPINFFPVKGKPGRPKATIGNNTGTTV